MNGTSNGIYSSDTDVCAICGGLGVVTADVPFGHPDYGKAFPCVCQREKIAVRRAERLRKLSNLDLYVNKTFGTFGIDSELLESGDMRGVFTDMRPDHRISLSDDHRQQINIAAERAYHFANDPRGWLLLKGSYGTGKTHLAAAIANWRLEHAEPVMFIVVPDLLDHLRATYSPTSDVTYDDYFDQVRTAPLLILDDLGSENQSAWAVEKLYQLFSHRHALQLPTVITTNRDPETLEARIRSRMLDHELVEIVTLEIPDRRNPATTWGETDLSRLDRYRDMTFTSFDLRQGEEGLREADLKRLEKTMQTAAQYAESPRGWFVLIGEPGCGKTHLAAAIAHETARNGYRTLFVSASELLDYLRATFYPGSNVSHDKRMDEIKTASVLVLDDLSIEKSLSSWARDKLYDILTHRFDYMLPTVITTSQPLKDMDARLRSRVANVSRSHIESITLPYYPGKRRRTRATAPNP
jgi:DNA replication protein DnaC